MKLIEGLIPRDIAGEHLLIPSGESAVKLHGIITMNDSGMLLYEKLKEGTTREELVQTILDQYEVDRETAEKDIDTYLAKLREGGLLQKDN